MSNPYFSFKKFTVYHDKCAMKVGIDGVLLGVWTTLERANKILDVGTGTGLIPLMLAQRCNSRIDAIEIDIDAFIQASENVSRSAWSNRIQVKQVSLQQFAEASTQGYDLIVSNPPFFSHSLKTSSLSRTTARHTVSLSHEELIVNAVKLLNPKGRICIILPVVEGLKCMDFALSKGLICSKQVTVYPKPNSPAKRMLLEFIMEFIPKVILELVIETEDRHQYSPEFTLLAKDYYLKL